jgi:hypothetical protein
VTVSDLKHLHHDRERHFPNVKKMKKPDAYGITHIADIALFLVARLMKHLPSSFMIYIIRVVASSNHD